MEKVYKHAALGVKLVKLLIELAVALILRKPGIEVDKLPGACCEEGLGKSVTVQRVEENESNVCMVTWQQESVNHYCHHN